MQKQLEVTQTLNIDELRKLANAEGPCITVSMLRETEASGSRADLQRIRSAIRQVESKLTEGWPGLPAGIVRDLVESLHLVEPDSTKPTSEGRTLVILRSREVFRAFELEEELDETVVVGDFFHVFPMIHSLQTANQTFYILALSQKNVRLLRCTRNDSEQVALPQNVPSSLEGWLNTRMPNSSPDRRPDSPANGSTAGSFTSTTDRDKKDEHLSNFFHVIDKGVAEVLRGQPHPLVLCAVESERAMYTKLNSYPHLCEEGVQGSPESLKGGDMHARALEAVQDFYSVPARKALEQWEKFGGTERVSTNFPAIVKAAFEARIAYMFAREDAHTMGVFDRDTMQMHVQGRQEDLVNAAALQTLAFAGEVFVMKPEDIPGGQQMAAILRY